MTFKLPYDFSYQMKTPFENIGTKFEKKKCIRKKIRE